VRSNPFSTRFIRPGAITFVFADGQSAGSLVQRLREENWWGQIIGDHGSGKSTLLATLIPALEAAGRRVLSITLHQGQHRLPPLDRSSLSTDTQLIIDGYEQLSWWPRWRAKSLCRTTGAGLLVTAHVDVALPTLYHTQPSESLAQAVVAKLVHGGADGLTPEEIASAYTATHGNIRETLFRLYDVYQQRDAVG
jgi:hypothetical protein